MPAHQAMSRPTYSAVSSAAARGKPCLVFVPNRKHARMSALDLLTHAAADGEPARFRLAEVGREGVHAVCPPRTWSHISNMC